ncbi:lactonase family protein [Paucibacter sp. KBW04]|uniref:lactonase family protein n=1 Tax=Paucibacter sp. KBW04 TaxID=2153361 RepID=UPI0018CC3295|nr:lactonase family protein [Paucibacter sp. KBW04]
MKNVKSGDGGLPAVPEGSHQKEIEVLNRRRLLQGAAALPCLGGGAMAEASVPLAAVSGSLGLALIGGYAPEAQGIQSLRYSIDEAQGGLGLLGPARLAAANAHSPSWLTLSPDGRRLYAVNEHENFEGRRSGSISSYAIEADAEAPLRHLSTVASGGAGPVHLSLHPGGRHAFVANYGSGHIAVLPLAGDGRLAAASQIEAAPGVAAGPAPHAHMALADPSGHFVLATDLGLNLLSCWRFDAASGRLLLAQRLQLAAGSGPRHLAFHPRLAGQLYLLNEQSSTLQWLSLDADSGRLQPRASLSSLPPGFAGRSYASDLLLSRDGRQLYALNRLHDSIAIFALEADGRPRWQAEVWAQGSYPRSFAFDAAQRRLFVCNQRSDHVAVFERDARDGGLRFGGQFIATPSPACIVLVPPPL